MSIYHKISEETAIRLLSSNYVCKLKVGHPDLIKVKLDSFQV